MAKTRMAEMESSIFNRKATEKLKSPDDLDKYVRVTNPSVWVVLAACIAFLIGLLAWGTFGTVSTNVTAPATCVNGKAMCFLPTDDGSKVHVGDTVTIEGDQFTVASISNVPISHEEASDILESDYLVSAVLKNDWAYLVTLEGDTSDLPDGVPLTSGITIARTAPITLLFGRKS